MPTADPTSLPRQLTPQLSRQLPGQLSPRRRPPEPLLRKVIGTVLRRARLLQGRTLRDVAASARVSMPYLSEIERGRKEASSEVLAAVCAALGLAVVDLVRQSHDAMAGAAAGPTSRILKSAPPVGPGPEVPPATRPDAVLMAA